jgi:hypothetical protein
MPHPQHTFIMTNSYRIASQIRLLTHSEFITRTTGYGSDHQYAVWNSEYNLAGWDALFVEKDREARYRPVLKRLFERVGPLEPVVVREDGYPVRTFYMMGCYRFRGEVGSKE